VGERKAGSKGRQYECKGNGEQSDDEKTERLNPLPSLFPRVGAGFIFRTVDLQASHPEFSPWHVNRLVYATVYQTMIRIVTLIFDCTAICSTGWESVPFGNEFGPEEDFRGYL
jgi:hypothetical protein